jgi:hypothetical protein
MLRIMGWVAGLVLLVLWIIIPIFLTLRYANVDILANNIPQKSVTNSCLPSKQQEPATNGFRTWNEDSK